MSNATLRGKSVTGKPHVVLALTVAVCAFSLATPAWGDTLLTYKVIDGVRDWSSTNGWYYTTGTFYGKCPTESEFIYLKGTDLAPETPLVIGSGMAAQSKTLQIASAKADNAALRVDEGASYAIAGAGGATWFSIGYAGRGALINNGGWVDVDPNSGFVLGELAGAHGTFSQLAGQTLWSNISAGYVVGATGVVNIAGGSFYANNWNWPGEFKVGLKGYGEINMTDGAFDGCKDVADANGGGKQILRLGAAEGGEGVFNMSGGNLKGFRVYLGYATNAVGRMTVTGGTCGFNRDFYVGVDGAGTMTVDNALFKMGELHVGGNGIGTGRMILSSQATNKVSYLYNQMTGKVYVGGGTNPDGGAGELVLDGGMLWLSGGNNLYVGDGAASGVLSGWGRIEPTDLTADWQNSLRVHIGSNGVVRADGGGMDRSLNFTSVYTVSNLVENALQKTNGWYAVNRGCVLLPFVEHNWASVVTRCLGDQRDSTTPTLVNSVCLSVIGTGGGTMHGGIYASDRTDCHLDTLPPHDRIVGVWRLGEHTEQAHWPGWEKGTLVTTLMKAKVTFRYDANALSPNAAKLVLYRYEDGGVWKRCAKKRLTGGDTPLIQTADYLTRLKEDPANIGTFALVEQPVNGLMILFK